MAAHHSGDNEPNISDAAGIIGDASGDGGGDDAPGQRGTHARDDEDSGEAGEGVQEDLRPVVLRHSIVPEHPPTQCQRQQMLLMPAPD